MTKTDLETLSGYVNDMLAVERDLHAALRHQKDDAKVKACQTAGPVLERLEDLVDEHLKDLQHCMQTLGDTPSSLKTAAGSILGTLAAIYDKLRDDRVSRMLRDDYAALCFACVCYEMLHTVALGAGQPEVAETSLRHIRNYAPMVMELSQVIPHVVMQELVREGKLKAPLTVASEAAENTQEAWREGSQAGAAV
jgi:hypothetical protein